MGRIVQLQQLPAYCQKLARSGTSFATAFQADYVIAEMGHIFTKYITPAEFFHGMIESADETYRMLICDGDPAYSARVDEVLAILKARGSKTVLLTAREGLASDEHTLVMHLPVSPYLFPMADVVLVEALGCTLAERLGRSPGELSFVRK